MNEHAVSGDGVETVIGADEALGDASAEAIPFWRFPFLLQASGRYEVHYKLQFPTPLPVPLQPSPMPITPMDASDDGEVSAAIALALLREDLRLDVDGGTPLMMASGTQYFRLTERLHWIARLARTGANSFAGPIWYKEGAVAGFPYTTVRIDVVRSLFPNRRRAHVTFSGDGVAGRRVTMPFVSAFLRDVEFEYDCAEGTTATLSMNTHAHPNRPATLRSEMLTIDTVFRRTGFDVKRTGSDAIVPISLAGSNGHWSDAEMHDAMQAYWSRFANKAQWSLWSFFASLHEWGTSLGGIMFDDIGPNHRQGCATFVDSFIKNAPPGDAAPAAWVQRMIFWTAIHEMGHCFNLAHSWQKTLGTAWIPLADEPEARSFMNYPFQVSGGETAFFSDFQYRFSDAELVFMRHAPARFVRMGDADWFDHHGFQQAAVNPQPALRLELRVNRQKPVFAFLEPVVLEMKLTNVSGEPQIVDERILNSLDHFTIVVKKKGRPACRYAPFAHYCFQPAPRVIAPGESMYESLFVAAGVGGWIIDEPGDYIVQAALHRDEEDMVSNALALRVHPPHNYLEEQIGQDFLSEDVGRVMAFDGSRILDAANAALVDVVERLPEHVAAIHARIALAEPLTRPHKVLEVHPDRPDVLVSASAAAGAVRPLKPDVDRAAETLRAALVATPETSAETLGHVDYNDYANRLSCWLEAQGDKGGAGKVAEEHLLTLSARGVIEPILTAIRERVANLGGDTGNRDKAKRKGKGKSTRSK